MACCGKTLGKVSVLLDSRVIAPSVATCATQMLRYVYFKENIVQPTLVANTQFLKSVDFKTDILTATLTKP